MSSTPPAFPPAPGAYGDKLTIETPEQTALEFPIAGVGSRFLAFGLDSLIQSLLGLVLLFVSIAFPAKYLSAISRLWAVTILLIFAFCLYFGYFAIFEAVWNGQTPGKRVVRIRVIKETGRPIAPVESVARNLMRIVDQLPAVYAVGIVSVLLSRQSKRLGDFVAGTIVVHERALQDIKPLWRASERSSARSYGSHALSEEDMALIESFMNRRDALEPQVRFDMADRIVKHIYSRLSVPPGDRVSGEKLLEAIAHERRSSAGYL
jgi:uncharacterized RDD family membrane protein YckC